MIKATLIALLLLPTWALAREPQSPPSQTRIVRVPSVFLRRHTGKAERDYGRGRG
jgi:hypothetical protein